MYSDVFSEVMGIYAEFFDAIPMESIMMLLLSYVLAFAFKVFITVAIAKDCDAKGIKNKVAWSVLSFLFSPLVPIIYACCRDRAKKKLARHCLTCNAVVTEPSFEFCPNCNSFALQPIPPQDAPKKEKASKIFCIIAVICYVVGSVLSLASAAGMVKAFTAFVDDFAVHGEYFDEYYDDILDGDYYPIHYGYETDGRIVYYDMKGNAYNDDEDVLYYDREGNVYELEESDSVYGYKFEDATGVEHDGFYVFVDSEGYFCYDANDEMMVDDDYNYVDANGNIYYDALEVSWDADGNMVDADGEMITVSDDVIVFE